MPAWILLSPGKRRATSVKAFLPWWWLGDKLSWIFFFTVHSTNWWFVIRLDCPKRITWRQDLQYLSPSGELFKVWQKPSACQPPEQESHGECGCGRPSRAAASDVAKPGLTFYWLDQVWQCRWISPLWWTSNTSWLWDQNWPQQMGRTLLVSWGWCTDEHSSRQR